MKTPRHRHSPRPPFRVFAVALIATAFFGSSGRNAVAKSTPAPSDSSARALRLSAVPGRNGTQINVNAVDRSTINPKLYVDTIGLRLWVDNVESRQRIRKAVASPRGALGVKQRLGAKLMETGVEPDLIPVRGKEGMQAGREDMVLLKGGEFARTGTFYDSSGGGLTILKDGTAAASRGAKYRVRVSSFYIDKYKVTNADYCQFLNDGNPGYRTPWNPRIAKAVEGRRAGNFVPADSSLAKHPVVLVNWYQAKGYAAWVGKQLPTEAQWEYAASGKEGRKYPWGNEPPDETRLDFPIKHKHPVPVDWFPKGATPDGVFQMAGNSAEWMADYFDAASYVNAPTGGIAIDPVGAKQPFQPETWYKFRVMFKGWCKSNRPEYFTSTKRHSRPPLADASAGVGFRCVESTSPPPAKAPFNARQAKTLQEQWAKHNGQPVVHTNSIGIKLAFIPPGDFTMGRTEEEFDKLIRRMKRDPELKKNVGGTLVWSMLMMPAHRVRITKPFYMGTTEVTLGQFRQFAKATGYKTEAEQGLVYGRPYKGRRAMSTWRKPMAWRKPPYRPKDNEPVLQLCYNDCMAFCKWLSKKEGVECSLPTEAQWEYACRAGTATPWNFGKFDDLDRIGKKHAIWSDTGQRFSLPQAVAQRKPNAFGLYDMHGNMWEYMRDWWHRLSYKEAPLNDPTGPAVQSEKGDQRRIIRGGSFDWGRWGAASEFRMRIVQRSNQHPHMSFRVVVKIKNAKGIPPAVDLDDQRRRTKRVPGADSKQVLAALKTAASKTPLSKTLTVELGKNVKMEFVLIPAGTFLMGSNTGPKDERPIHRVVVSKPFYMARHELTQSQWQAVLGPDPRLVRMAKRKNKLVGPTKAMNGLSWHDAQRFIRKLKEKSPGRAFSLPSEAQWEYACRAGSTTEYHFGNDASRLGEFAWFEGNMIWPGKPAFRDVPTYHDVGRKKPNQWGLYDMHGGVWEWCADRYDADYFLKSPLVDPRGPKTGRFHVLRGGSWFRYPKYARSAYRRFFHPEGDGGGLPGLISDFGFRLVINP